jgi:hypothetical protein
MTHPEWFAHLSPEMRMLWVSRRRASADKKVVLPPPDGPMIAFSPPSKAPLTPRTSETGGCDRVVTVSWSHERMMGEEGAVARGGGRGGGICDD